MAKSLPAAHESGVKPRGRLLCWHRPLIRKEHRLPPSDIPTWKRVASRLFGVLFVVVFLQVATTFGYFMYLWKHGAPTPTGPLTALITNKGGQRYVTPTQAATYKWMLRAMLGGGVTIFGT